jgi:hypothetical protein
MKGERLKPAGSLEPSSLATVVMASRDDAAGELRLLAAKYSCGKQGLWCKYNSSQAVDEKLPAADLTISVSSYPFTAPLVEVEVERVPNQVPGPLLRPLKMPTMRLRVAAEGAFSIPIPGFEDGDVYSLVVRPAPAGPLSRIEVDPSNATISADDALDLAARGFDSDGVEIGINPTWTAEGGSVNLTGSFTPHRVGSWKVSATVGTVTGSATVSVVPGRIASVAMEPRVLTMRVGEFREFSLAASDSKGNILTSIEIDWTVADPRVGEMHAANLTFEALGAGTTTLRASVTDGNATAVVEASIIVEATQAPPAGSPPIASLGPLAVVMLALLAGMAILGACALLIARRKRVERETSAPPPFFQGRA